VIIIFSIEFSEAIIFQALVLGKKYILIVKTKTISKKVSFKVV